MDRIRVLTEQLSSLPMPAHAIAPLAEASRPTHAGAAAVRNARFWDRVAVKYAADPIADMAGYEATLRRVQGLLSAHLDVLEIGCGTGSTAFRLAPFTRRLLATDLSAGMIAIAREKLAAQPVSQLSFAVADADAPVADDGEYDAVLAFNVLHLVTDLDRALELAVQSLRPGGLLISKTVCIAELNPLIRYLALPLMQAVGKAPNVLCFDADALRSAIARQGMDIVSVERHGTRGKDFRVFILARKPA
jgi:ubiquinone/menaquinone biosynthesis C-methylase UbiE